MRSYTDLTGKGAAQIPFAEVPVADAAAYCGADSATVLALHEIFAPQLREMALAPLLDDLEMPLVEVLVDMEWAGIAIDRPLFERLSRELARRPGAARGRDRRRRRAPRSTSTRRSSSRQVLFEQHQLPVLKKTKTGPSTDADVLEQLAAMGHELPRLILDYRELQKLRVHLRRGPAGPGQRRHRADPHQLQPDRRRHRAGSQFVRSEPAEHPGPHPAGRGDPRAASSPAPGCRFVVADYSPDRAAPDGAPLRRPRLHRRRSVRATTSTGRRPRIIFGVPLADVTSEMRARAKTINFGTIYGQGPFALSKQLGITQEEAKEFIAQYFERFAGVRAFLDRQVELAREQGYVETLLGRRRYIPEIRDKNFNVRAFGERTAQNTPLQGSAADLIKVAMIGGSTTRSRRAGLRTRMLLQVHDELVFEAPEAEVERVRPLVKGLMEGAATLSVPLVVDVGVGENWLEAKR